MRSLCRAQSTLLPAFFSAASALGVLALATPASAQIANGNGSGLDTHLFRPAIDSKGLFTVNGSDIVGAGDISFGLIIDYGKDILRTSDDRKSDNRWLVNHSFQGTAQFNYGLFNRFVVGLDLPVNLMAGDEQSTNGQTAQPANLWAPNQLNSQTLGYMALHAKWRITRVEKGIGLALMAQAGFSPTDAPQNAGADPGFWYWPQGVVEKRFGSTGNFRVALNAGYRGHTSHDTTLILRGGDTGVFKDGDLFTYGGGVSYRIAESLDLVGETYATYLLSNSADSQKASNEVVGGLKIFVERNSYFMIGAGPRYGGGFESADVRGFIGFIFEPSIGDRDGDGIKDDVDKCPDEPEDFDGFQDEDGCPDPDNDNDGIPDKVDRCPQRARRSRRRSRRGRLPRDQRRRPRRRRNSRFEGQVPRRSRGQGRLRGRRRLPRS